MSAVKKVIVVEQLRRSQMNEMLSKGKRLDGRGLLDTRELIVTPNVIEKAEGSARVKLWKHRTDRWGQGQSRNSISRYP